MLLRWLSACILVCLVGTGIFYVLVQLGDDVSVHRRGMNAAAYRAQLYVDQREALLNYLVDSVVNVHTPARRRAPGGMTLTGTFVDSDWVRRATDRN